MEIQELKPLLQEDLNAELFALIEIETNKRWLVAHIKKYGIEIQWNPYGRSPNEYQVGMRWLNPERKLSKVHENYFDLEESRAVSRAGLRKQLEFMINKIERLLEKERAKKRLYKKIKIALP